MDPLGPFIIFIILSILMIAVSWYLEIKRREALQTVAAELELSFSPGDPFDIDGNYTHLKGLRRGDYEWATNVIFGKYRNHEVKLFDYHYEIEDTDSEGNKETHHYSFSAAILTLSREFPDLLARPEGLFDKLVQGFGFDDIDLDNHEFSRKFMVKGDSKKFAYDIFSPRMMEYFLDSGKLCMEIGKDSLLMIYQQKMRPDTMKSYLDIIVDVRDLFPEYLFKECTVVDTIPDNIPDTIPDTIQNSTQDTISDTIQNSTQDTISDTMQNSTQDTIPDTMQNSTQDTISDTMQNSTQDTISDTMQNSTQDTISDTMQNSTQDTISDTPSEGDPVERIEK